jgi:hypothetical protein
LKRGADVNGILSTTHQLEAEIEAALETYEQDERFDQALDIYRQVEAKLLALGLAPGEPGYQAQQGVLAYCLMRQANLLRIAGQKGEALALGQREIAAARASGDDLALARSLLNLGATQIAGGELAQGLELTEEARALFEQSDQPDYRQGLGWYWILRADLINLGYLPLAPVDVIAAADQALAILLPLENYPGVARAYAARAKARTVLNDLPAAEADRQAQERYEQLAGG